MKGEERRRGEGQREEGGRGQGEWGGERKRDGRRKKTNLVGLFWIFKG